MTVAERQQSIIDDLSILPDAQERLSALVSQAATYKLPETDKTEANIVKGCVSRVWLMCRCEDGVCRYASDADSPMVKGLVHLLCSVYDGASPDDVITTEPVIWDKLGISKNLSPTRLNGLAAVRTKIREFAASQI